MIAAPTMAHPQHYQSANGVRSAYDRTTPPSVHHPYSTNPPRTFPSLPTPPPADDFRARLNASQALPDLTSSMASDGIYDRRHESSYRLPQPMPDPLNGRRLSSPADLLQEGNLRAHSPATGYGGLPNSAESYADHAMRRGSGLSQQQQQQMYMVPAYMPYYQTDPSAAAFSQWPPPPPHAHHAAMMAPYAQPGMLPMGINMGVNMGLGLPGYPMVQRPLPPAPPGPVEKPRKRRSPPSPQYLHMTVQEMIEELAYREIDTAALQQRKAKKAEYIDRLQQADRAGRRGRGAWKSCHGDVPPLDAVKDTAVRVGN
jgi:hypothetical protein